LNTNWGSTIVEREIREPVAACPLPAQGLEFGSAGVYLPLLAIPIEPKRAELTKDSPMFVPQAKPEAVREEEPGGQRSMETSAGIDSTRHTTPTIGFDPTPDSG
jgi:hypothetical protein